MVHTVLARNDRPTYGSDNSDVEVRLVLSSLDCAVAVFNTLVALAKSDMFSLKGNLWRIEVLDSNGNQVVSEDF
jgi:hypothetical protein